MTKKTTKKKTKKKVSPKKGKTHFSSDTKWKLFADHILDNGGLVSDAYREVYGDNRLKPSSIHSMASKLFNSSKVQEYIAKRQEEIKQQVNVNQTLVARKCLQILNVDASGASEALTIDQLEKLPLSVRRLIKNIKKTKTTTTNKHHYGRDERVHEVETYDITWMDKDKALESLAKHTGFYMKDNINMNKDINKKSFTDALKELDI